MATKKSGAEISPIDVPEINPSAGGSYTRHSETGELTQTEGLDFDAASTAPPPPLPDTTLITQE